MLANEACDQERKINIEVEIQLLTICKGIVKVDKMHMPTIRIRTRKTNIQEQLQHQTETQARVKIFMMPDQRGAYKA